VSEARRFPRVTDAIGRPLPPLRPEHAEGARLVVERMLWEPGARLTPSGWVSAYCRAIERPQDLTPWPLPSAVEAAGLLLARAIAAGWIADAPGPRGGQGWSITTAGLMPVEQRRRRA